VSRLQKEIIEILMDELTSTITDENHDVSRLRLLLGQLRYLPHIKDSENLTTKLLDIIDVASYPSQLEILDSIPEILPDSEYNETAKELGKMLDKNDNLSAAIIDCLNALNLSPEIRAQIQDHVLAKILTGTSTKIFPVFLDFLMADLNARTLPGTLVKIRNALNTIMASNNKENESCKVVIFNRLQKAAALKLISESWLTVISSIKTSTDHKPVDLLILFMLHSCSKLKKRTVEATFRKRIKDGQFKCALLEQLFEKYLPQQLVRDYFTTVVEVASSLLRCSNDHIVTEFAGTLFKLLFTHEHTDRTSRQEILENMIVFVGASDQKNVNVVLNIIFDLLDEIAKTPNHAIILMRLLEELDRFELKDVKLVFQILCSLTCSDESLLGLKEEIHMVVRKQLSSSKRQLKHRGIVSAVVMVKNIATTTEDQSSVAISEDSILSVAQLQGPAKEAAAIMELTNTSTSGCHELVGLYYDQLATVLLKTENLDKHFLVWLYETITNDFQTIFVTESVCTDVNDLQFSMQYNLNSDEEIDAPLAVNIAELTLKPEKHSVLTLAPHFRLLRLLHYKQQDGDLASIDALLGCGVVLPKMEQRDCFGIEQLKQVSDCLFHCINWFREVINGFVTQKNRKLRYKVIQRLDNLIELEKLLVECLDSIPEHKLPTSYFDVLSQTVHKNVAPMQQDNIKAAKRPKKKLKTKEFVEDSTVAPSTSTARVAKISKDEQRFSFREMDTDLVLLIKYPLSTEDVTSSDQTCLNINQLNFILKDFVMKLSLVTKGRDLGLSHLTDVSPLRLITDCVPLLSNLNKHLGVIDKRLSECVDEDDLKQMQITFGSILECLYLIFSWSGFQHSKRFDLLREILKAFRQSDDNPPLNSVNHLILELTNRLADFVDRCSSLSQAVSLIKTMEALNAITPSSAIQSKIAKTAGQLLNKQWDVSNSVNVDALVKSYLCSANIKTICGMVGTIQEQAPDLTNKTDSLDMLRSVNKSNFYVLYRNLWESLHDRVKTEIQALTNAQHLTLWRTTAVTMQGLMTVAKAQETKLNLVCFLKKSIAILKIFLSHGVPILEIELKSHPDQVVEILKTIQSNTRFLHHLCCYSKLNQDASLMSHVPQFRLTLESLVYRVKAALVANGCSAAFWMGNLKNRDLQGEDILSQSTENTTRDDEEEDEVMPSDDDNSENDSDVNKSGSEVFD
jgi:Fanconi anemia group D2 protein